ncbi:hypothetical protein GCM10010400_75590 [Streptomyces aculeolatus]|uniref:hypothetical protein n=1 Tax=Streptomyces aculeolatus TaxID=270689 RepID=UPI001CED27D3|nr:hypothetical protein [Streptomyces aculeolatus]
MIPTRPSAWTVGHGYSLADVDRLARTSVAAARGAGVDAATRYGLAWSAIAETIVGATEPPARAELVQAGWKAIHAELRAVLHARGYRDGHVYEGAGSSPRYWRYWWTPADEGAVDRVTDAIAVQQALAVLTPTQLDAVAALAAHDDYAAAAEALGWPYKRLASRVAEGRRRIAAAWYAPDSPPARRGHDKRRGTHAPRERCSAGHLLDGDNVRVRRRRGGKAERICRSCEAARSQARAAA